MTGFMQPEPVSREAARELIGLWRADSEITAISTVSSIRNRDYALRELWVATLTDINSVIGTLWADDEKLEYGLISWRYR